MMMMMKQMMLVVATFTVVVPAKAGTQLRKYSEPWLWIPAFAGTTVERLGTSAEIEEIGRAHV